MTTLHLVRSEEAASEQVSSMVEPAVRGRRLRGPRPETIEPRLALLLSRADSMQLVSRRGPRWARAAVLEWSNQGRSRWRCELLSFNS